MITLQTFRGGKLILKSAKFAKIFKILVDSFALPAFNFTLKCLFCFSLFCLLSSSCIFWPFKLQFIKLLRWHSVLSESFDFIISELSLNHKSLSIFHSCSIHIFIFEKSFIFALARSNYISNRFKLNLFHIFTTFIIKIGLF